MGGSKWRLSPSSWPAVLDSQGKERIGPQRASPPLAGVQGSAPGNGCRAGTPLQASSPLRLHVLWQGRASPSNLVFSSP